MEMPSNTVTAVIKVVAPFFMIFGGIAPFVPQYLLIYKNKHCDGFSTYVCLNILISNILRICFWYGRPFELPLLLQSIIMIITMIVLINLCVRVSLPEITKSDDKYTIWDFNYRYFWRWTDFNSYVVFLITFTLISAMFTRFMLTYPVIINGIGFLALFLESMLGAPQFYRNWRKKSTKGMSISMVIMWTAGDIFKTAYFILRSAPEQFIICGSIQVTLDVLIFLQYICYR